MTPKLGGGGSSRADIACGVLKVGTKVIIGGGLGLLIGVASTTVATGAAELLVAGSVTKICALVGSAFGLKIGLSKNKKMHDHNKSNAKR